MIRSALIALILGACNHACATAPAFRGELPIAPNPAKEYGECERSTPDPLPDFCEEYQP